MDCHQHVLFKCPVLLYAQCSMDTVHHELTVSFLSICNKKGARGIFGSMHCILVLQQPWRHQKPVAQQQCMRDASSRQAAGTRQAAYGVTLAQLAAMQSVTRPYQAPLFRCWVVTAVLPAHLTLLLHQRQRLAGIEQSQVAQALGYHISALLFCFTTAEQQLQHLHWHQLVCAGSSNRVDLVGSTSSHYRAISR